MTWRSRPDAPYERVVGYVDVRSPTWPLGGVGHEEVEMPLRRLMLRVPSGTPGSVFRCGHSWLVCTVVIGPREPMERAAKSLGLSVALSWLASEWDRKGGGR